MLVFTFTLSTFFFTLTVKTQLCPTSEDKYPETIKY